MTTLNGTGVLQVTSGIRNRTFQEFLNQVPLTDLILDSGTVYGQSYLTVEPVGGNWAEMTAWARKIYGEPGNIWDIYGEDRPLRHSSWYMNDRKFWFRDPGDTTLFILRWR